MAKKNTTPVVKVTHTEMICWSINYQKSRRDEYVAKKERVKSALISDAEIYCIESWCDEEITRIDSTLCFLYQMYQIETGKEYCG